MRVTIKKWGNSAAVLVRKAAFKGKVSAAELAEVRGKAIALIGGS